MRKWPDLAAELYEQVDKSLKARARLVDGGKPSEEGLSFFDPTILADIPIGAPAYHEELFGPVATIFRIKNKEQAIALANDSEFGLGASIWSEVREKAEDLANKIESGSVFINSIVASNLNLPFGGIK